MSNILNRIYRYITLLAIIVSIFLIYTTIIAGSPNVAENHTVILNPNMPESASPHQIGEPKIEEKEESKDTTLIKDEIETEKEVINQNSVNTKVKSLTKKEYEVLTRIVEAEATGGDLKSKMIVANVILNRVEDDQFPDTIKDVVFQKNGNVTQFSPVADGRYYSVSVTAETMKAVDKVLAGEDNSKGALFFVSRASANKKSLNWFDNNLKPLFQYGGHEYYTTK